MARPAHGTDLRGPGVLTVPVGGVVSPRPVRDVRAPMNTAEEVTTMDKRFTPIASATCNARTADVVVADAGFVGHGRPVLGPEVPLT